LDVLVPPNIPLGDVGKPLMHRSDGVRLEDLLVERKCLQVEGLGGTVVGALTDDVPEPRDAVGLATEVADLLVEGQGFLVAGLGGVVVGAGKGDDAEAEERLAWSIASPSWSAASAASVATSSSEVAPTPE
jgi:hypothetical protein